MVNTANLATFAGMLFAVIPAMALLYYVLHRFEGFFDEKRLFKLLMVGMAIGAVVTLVEVLALRLHEPFRLQASDFQSGVLPLVAMYPLLEGVAKTASLNWHTLAGRRDTPYYGVSFGLGFGAILTFILVAREYARILESPALGSVSHLDIAATSILLFVLFVAGMMMHAVSCALVGRATAERDVLRALGYGTLVGVPFYLAYALFWAYPGGAVRVVAPFACLALAWWLLQRAGMRTLEGLVPDDLAKQVRRDMRRRQRGP